MIKFRLLAAAAVAVLCLAALPRLTKACDPGCQSLLGMRAFGYSGTLYGLGYVPVPPYFALHPPVYYGERYFRSYGGSPFARRANETPKRRVTARVIVNPHVKPLPTAPKKKPAAKNPTAQAQLIINPFYDGPATQLAAD